MLLKTEECCEDLIQTVRVGSSCGFDEVYMTELVKEAHVLWKAAHT